MVDTPAKSAEIVTVGMLAQRLDGMDEAIRLIQAVADKQPTTTYVQGEVHALEKSMAAQELARKELTDEKFNGISTQFTERDKRTEQLSIADKTAIAAALQAQKEAAAAQNESNATANAKMETNFAKLIEQGQALLLEVKKNLEGQVGDIKSRQDKGEGRTTGAGALWGYIIGGVGLIATIITIVMVFAARGGA